MEKIRFFFVFYIMLYFGEGSVHFYDAMNYKGEFFQTNNVPYGVHDILNYSKVVSVKTSECLVLIEKNGTKSDISIVIEPLGHPNIYDIDPAIVPNKFSLCSDYFGPRYTKQGVIAAFDQNRTVTLDVVKGCFTFPTSQGQLQWISNFGNCIILYMSANCQGEKLEVRGGVSKNSLNPPNSYKSMSLCITCPGCSLLNVTLLEIKLIEDKNKTDLMNATVDLDTHTHYSNKGNAIVNEFYNASKGLREAIALPRTSSLLEMNFVELSPHFHIHSAKNLSYIFGNLLTTLNEAYAKVDKPVKHFGGNFVKEVITRYEVGQRIKFDACTKHVVRTYVRIWENFPISFELYFTIRDAHSPPVLTSEMIETTLNDIFTDPRVELYSEEDDEHIVLKFTDELYATFGQEIVIEGRGGIDNYCPKYDWATNDNFDYINKLI